MADPRAILPQDTLRVGFGCADLLGTLSADESEKLLRAAIDSGITYFDTARMYGSGQAEAILGRLMPEHRARIVLVSKAGILPPSRALPVRLARKAAGLAFRPVPGLQRKILDTPPLGARLGVFDLPSLTASLDISLKDLRTDHLDILLLHEIAPSHINPPLIAWLHEMQRIGKLRAFGIASDFPDTIRIIADAPEIASIVQFASSAWQPDIEKLPHDPARLVVSHSCLGKRFHQLNAWLAASPGVAQRWSRALDIDAAQPAALARLLLLDALAANADGIVLFSSRRPENIAANAAHGRTPADPAQRVVLRQLLAEFPA